MIGLTTGSASKQARKHTRTQASMQQACSKHASKIKQYHTRSSKIKQDQARSSKIKQDRTQASRQAAQRQENRAPTENTAAAAEFSNEGANAGSCVAAVYQQSTSSLTAI